MNNNVAYNGYIFFRNWRTKVLKYCTDDAQLAEFMRALWDAAFDGKEYTGDNLAISMLLEEMMPVIEHQRKNFQKHALYNNNNNYNNNNKYKSYKQKNSFSSEVSKEDIEDFKRRININGE